MKSQSQSKKMELSLNDMWSLNQNKADIGGIEGYVVPNICKVNSKKKEYAAPKKEDENGNPIIIKRPNFLDEVVKWANSYYDKEKAEKVKEELEGKGRSLDSKPKPKEHVQRKDPPRQFFTDLLIREEKRKYEYLEDKQEIIQEIISKTKEWQESQPNYLEAMKKKYFPPNDEGKSKGSLPKSTRVTVVSDAEHIGEKYPFYNTYVKDDDDSAKKKLFYPSVCQL